jgi:aryl-alcohol dehydrogenase-like predicted oxidoreductase
MFSINTVQISFFEFLQIREGISKMILGTAQLGMKYGISNFNDKPTREESTYILEAAYKGGIRILDTAPTYGEAESIIGNFHQEHDCQYLVCTKLPVNIPENDIEEMTRVVRVSLTNSLARLKLTSAFCCYLHRFEQCKNKELINLLDKMKSEGLIKKIGISIYQPNELTYICNHLVGFIDVVQIPLNIFSGCLWNPFLKLAFESGFFIYARSIFLQGLVFLDPDDSKVIALQAEKYLKYVQDFASNRNRSVAQICYDSIAGNPYISEIIVGCESIKQINNNLLLGHNYKMLSSSDYGEIYMKMKTIPHNVLNPSVWNSIFTEKGII